MDAFHWLSSIMDYIYLSRIDVQRKTVYLDFRGFRGPRKILGSCFHWNEVTECLLGKATSMPFFWTDFSNSKHRQCPGTQQWVLWIPFSCLSFSSLPPSVPRKIFLHVCVCISVYVHACLGEFTLWVVHVHLRYCSLETIQPFSLFLSLIVCLRQETLPGLKLIK